MYMHRSLQYPSIRIPDYPDKNPIPQRVPFIWTGRVADGDCLVNPKLKRCPPYLAGSSIADLKPHGADCAGGLSSARHSRKRKRQDSASCPLILRPGGPSNDEGGQGNPLTYKPGEPSPTCASGCRKLCTEYYCSPIPTGTPPDFWDPEDPAHPPQTSDAPGSDPTPLSSTMTTTTTTTPSTSKDPPADDPTPPPVGEFGVIYPKNGGQVQCSKDIDATDLREFRSDSHRAGEWLRQQSGDWVLKIVKLLIYY